jgi:hypothetical protein
MPAVSGTVMKRRPLSHRGQAWFGGAAERGVSFALFNLCRMWSLGGTLQKRKEPSHPATAHRAPTTRAVRALAHVQWSGNAQAGL